VGPFSFFLILLSSLLWFVISLPVCLRMCVCLMFLDCSALSPLTALLYSSSSLNISSHLLSSVFRTACPLLDLSAYQKYTHYLEHHLATNQNSTASFCIHLTLYSLV
jgi:hypothetical protein